MRLSLPLIGTLVVTSLSNAVIAQTPQPEARTVVFLLHANPSDPDSVVHMRIAIDIEPVETIGNQVAWDANWLEITRFDSNSEITERWYASAPSFATSDGMWRISHVDADEPSADEFASPPAVSGVAHSYEPLDPALEYSLAANANASSPTPRSIPYPITAMLDYSFRRLGDSEPIGEGEGEPVDIPGSDNDPE